MCVASYLKSQTGLDGDQQCEADKQMICQVCHAAILVKCCGERIEGSACICEGLNTRARVRTWCEPSFVLQGRGCPLKGLPSTPTLEAHQHRFLTNGWEKAHAVDLDTIYKQHIDPQDKRRSCFTSMHGCLQLTVKAMSMVRIWYLVC